MDEYQRKEVFERDGNRIEYIWHPGTMPADIAPQQVYGFASTTDGLVTLVRDHSEDRFTPPGGAVEPGETAVQALIREFQEEAQIYPNDIRLLGSLEVINPSAVEPLQRHNLQVRFACTIDDVGPFTPFGQSGFEIEERIFVHYTELPRYIDWLSRPTGKAQWTMYCDLLEHRLVL